MSVLLVYGWYGRGNVGDELMRLALLSMFSPRGIKLRFVDRLNVADLLQAHGIVFGGGCILQDDPLADPEALNMLLAGELPVFYLGVGAETDISPAHLTLLALAKAVVVRSEASLQKLPEATLLPDLAYSLRVPKARRVGNGLLVVTNVEVVPTSKSPHWMHVSWERYKDELAQALSVLLCDHGLHPTFLALCRNADMDDAWPAHEIIARMANRSTSFEVHRAVASAPNVANIASKLARFIGQHAVVLTQRYHGIVMAQHVGVPHVSVSHHDKLQHAWPSQGINLSFHGCTKRQLEDAVLEACGAPRKRLHVDRARYDEVALLVESLLGGS